MSKDQPKISEGYADDGFRERLEASIAAKPKQSNRKTRPFTFDELYPDHDGFNVYGSATKTDIIKARIAAARVANLARAAAKPNQTAA